jgi:hypothetical protein
LGERQHPRTHTDTPSTLHNNVLTRRIVALPSTHPPTPHPTSPGAASVRCLCLMRCACLVCVVCALCVLCMCSVCGSGVGAPSSGGVLLTSLSVGSSHFQARLAGPLGAGASVTGAYRRRSPNVIPLHHFICSPMHVRMGQRARGTHGTTGYSLYVRSKGDMQESALRLGRGGGWL